MTSGGVPDLSEVLDRIGLSSYLDRLTAQGFADWETVLDITEDDLSNLGFKLGHRRTLQREIATFRGIPPTESLDSIEQCSPPPPQAAEVMSVSSAASPPPREKRRYRRHPRPDPNAPKKPKTAYVNFADQLRTHPEISSLSFVDIAKEVGRRWQVLPAEQKRVWESQAARAMQEFEVQMDDYKKTESWRKYQTYLAEFKAQQAQAAKSKRGSASRIDSFVRGESSRASPASSDSPTSLPSSSSGATDAELRHNALTLAFSELVSLRGEVLAQGVHPYGEQHLPPEPLLHRAMHAFVQGTGSVLYIWTHGQVDEILARIYRPNVQVDAITLAECFIVAAMGAHYDMECFPDHIRRLLYASGSLQFNEETAGVNHFRTMRLLLSMSFYALLEKHLSARYLVAAGLQIARSSSPLMRRPDSEVQIESWQRIFRSLIFMDCWLSYTLGYMSEIRSEDIAFACTSCPVDHTTVDDIIHSQFSKIGIVAAEINNALANPDRVTHESFAKLAQKLEAWRVGVPEPLSLDAITSSSPANFTKFQRRAILMVHIMHLGAVVLLYRRQLVATTEAYLQDGGEWTKDLSVADANKCRDECAAAGQQVARILRLLSFDGTLTTRCWLLIYWAFTAAVVLLFSASTKLLSGHYDTVDADLSYAKSCMDILIPCSSSEPIAKRYLEVLTPLYDSLCDTHHRVLSRAKTSIFMLIQPESTQSPPIPVSKKEVGPSLEKLCQLLKDPFGRKQAAPTEWGGRRVLNSDGSYSIYWWR